MTENNQDKKKEKAVPRNVIIYRDNEFACFSSLKLAADALGINYRNFEKKKFPFVYKGVRFERKYLNDVGGIVADKKGELPKPSVIP